MPGSAESCLFQSAFCMVRIECSKPHMLLEKDSFVSDSSCARLSFVWLMQDTARGAVAVGRCQSWQPQTWTERAATCHHKPAQVIVSRKILAAKGQQGDGRSISMLIQYQFLSYKPL